MTTTWLGLAGGGFGFSAIGGMGVYQIDLWNMNGYAVPIRARIIGKRLGLTLQAEAAHALCLMTGVHSSASFTELKSQGVDWALALGVKADSFFKAGSKAAKVISEIAATSANWATHETTKKAVQGLVGDFSIGPDPSFILLPTPVALAAGAGVWYEWQTLEKVGGDITWDYLKPDWRVEASGGRVLLRMRNIPEQDGSTFNFRIRTDNWGADNTIIWATRAGGSGDLNLNGVVYDGRLYDSRKGGSRGQADGFDLSAYYPVGHSVTGILTVSRDTEVATNTTFKIGVSVCQGRINLYRWESDDYVSVTSGADGRLTSAPSSTVWHD